MSKNSEVVGIAVLLLILSSKDNLSTNGNNSPVGSLFRAVQINGILRELHKFTDVINRVDHLGQIALNPPELPKLSSPEQLLGGNLPDLSNIVETMGPLLSAFTGNSQRENQNDIF